MSGWAAKRFWAAAAAVEVEGGWSVHLDGRPVKTPAKAALVVPTAALAGALAAEWDAQSGEIRPATMPLTRMANSAIDKVLPLIREVVAEIARYGESDLLCYRATGPAELVARQGEAWDPLLAWAAAGGPELAVTVGITHVPQASAALKALTGRVEAHDHFGLAPLHDLVAIPGSLVLGLAVSEGRLSPDAAFDLSRIDEDWQVERWGDDEEAAESAALKRQAMRDAGRFLELCR